MQEWPWWSWKSWTWVEPIKGERMSNGVVVTRDMVEGKAVYGLDVIKEDQTLKQMRKIVDGLVKQVSKFEEVEAKAVKKSSKKK